MIKDLFAAFARHAMGLVAGLLSFALVGRVLGSHALGAWAILGTLAFLLGLADLGTSTAVQRAEARGEPVDRAFGLALASVVVTGPVFALLSLYGLPVPALPAFVVALAGLCFAYGFPARALLLVRGRLADLAWAKSGGAFAQVVVTCATLLFHRDLVSPALGALAGAVVELWWVLRALRRVEPGLSLLPRWAPGARAIFAEGAASLVLNLSVVLAVRIDVFVLGRVAPLTVVAAYGVAARAVDQSYVLAKQASAALLSRIVHGGERRAQVVTEGARALGVLVASGMAALAHVGPVLLAAWVGKESIGEATHVALALLGLAASIAAIHDIPASALSLAGRTPWAATRAIGFGAMVNVLVSVAFARAYGAFAVAFGTVAGNAVTCALVFAASRGKEGPVLREIVPPVLAAATAAHVVGFASARYATTFPLAAAAALVVVLSGFLAALPFVLRASPERVQEPA